MAEAIEIPLWDAESEKPKELRLKWGPDPPRESAILRGKGHADDADASFAKMAEPIDMPFGLWTQVGQGSIY